MIRPFRLHRPTTVDEAVALAGDLPDAAFYFGGTELLQVMKMGLARFDHLIDLKRIAELRSLVVGDSGALTIGAGMTHREIERSADVTRMYPGLVELEHQVANVRVRNAGSIGGNLCFAEPHSDPATFLLAAEARLVLRGAGSTRTVTIEDFVLDAMTTDLEPGELLAAIELPPPTPTHVVAYRRLAFVERPIASVAVSLSLDGDRVHEARVAVGSVGDRPVLLPRAAEALVGADRGDLDEAGQAVEERVRADCEAVEDHAASAEYRQHLAGLLARRAVAAAGEGLHGG